MNIFQTIWTALTTENAALTSWVIIPLYFIEAFVSMKLFTIILNIDSTKKRKILYILSVGLLGIIIKIFFSTPYNTYLIL